MPRGVFITIEGIPGAGVTTQVHRLASGLTRVGYEVVMTRDPGGTPEAEEIRRLLVEEDQDRWSTKTRLLLSAAARNDQFEKLIAPSLQAGKVVICDRFIDRELIELRTNASARDLLWQVYQSTVSIMPDRTFILDVPGLVTLQRAGLTPDEFGLAELQRMRRAYVDLPDAWRSQVINGDQDPVRVANEMFGRLERDSRLTRLLPVTT